MKQALAIRIVVLLSVSALVALVSGYLLLSESADLSGALVNGIGPLCPLVVGIAGLYHFGREGVIRDDMLHTMGLMLSLGTLVMVLPESAVTVISQTSDPAEFYFTIALLQVPGVLMWTIGISSYLHVFNRTVCSVAPRRLVFFLSLLSVVIVGGVKAATVSLVKQRSIVEFLACLPLSLCIVFMVGSLLFLLRYFRSGTLAIPTGFLLVSMILLLAHSLLWCTFTLGPDDALLRTLSIEAYLMVGVSLTAMGDLNSL